MSSFSTSASIVLMVNLSLQYDACAEEYASLQDRYYSLYPNLAREALLQAVTFPIQGKQVLDAGCGTGDDLALLQAQGAQCHGIDSSRAMIAIARRRHPHIPFSHAPIECTGFADHSFDCIVSKYALHYCRDLTAALTELTRILRPQGSFVSVVMHPALCNVFRSDASEISFPLFNGGLTVRVPVHSMRDYYDAMRQSGLRALSFQESDPHPVADAKVPVSVPWFCTITASKLA